MRHHVPDLALLFVGLSAVALVVYHAATWPVTHDEALTYNLFLAGPWPDVFRGHSNNHALFTWLAKASVTALGPSAFTLRLPTVLAAAGYVAAAASIARRRFAGVGGPVVLALLCFNPLVLDYLVAARGYGLALALLMGAERMLLVGRTDARGCRVIGVCAGLSVAANLAFAVPAGVVLAIATVVRRRTRLAWLHLSAPAALAAGAVLWPYLAQATPGQFYLGRPSARDAVADLYGASVRHDRTAAASLADVGNPHPRSGWTPADATGLAVVVVALSLAGMRRGPPPAAVFIPVGCVAAVLAMHVLLGTRWPVARTVVYLVPTGTLAVAAAVRRPTPALVAAAVLLATYAAQLPTRCLRYARYDAGSATVFSAVAADVTAHPLGRPARVNGSWVYAEALTFYRSTRHAEAWLAPVDRHDPAAPAGFDYFVYNPADYPGLTGVEVIYADPESGARVGRVRTGVAASAAATDGG